MISFSFFNHLSERLECPKCGTDNPVPERLVDHIPWSPTKPCGRGSPQGRFQKHKTGRFMDPCEYTNITFELHLCPWDSWVTTHSVADINRVDPSHSTIMTETRRNPHRNVRRKHFHLGAINDVQASSPSTSTDVDMTFSPRSRSTPFSIVEAPKHGSFLVALDFGTALTSVSYFKFDAEQRPSSILTSEVKSIMNWPSSPQHSQRKAIAVPSESWYLNGEYLWGYQVRKKVKSLTSSSDGAASESIIRFSKLLLSDRGQLSEEVEEILDRMGKDNMSVIKDYLSEIFLHTRNQLEELENFCEQCHLELTLCVPSGWRSETMFRLTKIVDEATTETGLRGSSFDFFIIEEPEAAATLALNDDNIRGNLKVRLVCSLLR